MRATPLWMPEGIQSVEVIIGMKFGNSGIYSCSKKLFMHCGIEHGVHRNYKPVYGYFGDFIL